MRRAALLLAALALSACANAPARAVRTVDLANTSWVVVDPDLPAGARAPTIQFSGDGASGFTGCNRWSARTQTHAGGALRFQMMAVTEMACPPPAMEIEAAFLAKLNQVRAVEHDSAAHELRLIGGEAQTLARLTAAAPD